MTSFRFGVSEKREIEEFIRAVKILNESPYTLSSATERLNHPIALKEAPAFRHGEELRAVATTHFALRQPQNSLPPAIMSLCPR